MTIAHYNVDLAELRCVCSCGREYTLPAFPGDKTDTWLQEKAAELTKCPECVKAEEELMAAKKAKEQVDYLICETERRIDRIGIPPHFRGMEKPPVRSVAEWIWENRTSNILLKGPTGSGKTTSAVFVAEAYAKRRTNIRYFQLREIIAEYVELKKDEKPAAAVARFLCSLGALDVLILDEVINKCVVSLSGQELLFELIDAVYSERFACRLWLLGNFESGSIEELFKDAAPIYRRLRESFLCAEIREGKIEILKF